MVPTVCLPIPIDLQIEDPTASEIVDNMERVLFANITLGNPA